MYEPEKYLFDGKKTTRARTCSQRSNVLPAGLKAGKRKADIGPGVPTTTIIDENYQAELIYVTPPRPPLTAFGPRLLPIENVVSSTWGWPINNFSSEH